MDEGDRCVLSHRQPQKERETQVIHSMNGFRSRQQGVPMKDLTDRQAGRPQTQVYIHTLIKREKDRCMRETGVY